jgi:hypothetical protein
VKKCTGRVVAVFQAYETILYMIDFFYTPPLFELSSAAI